MFSISVSYNLFNKKTAFLSNLFKRLLISLGKKLKSNSVFESVYVNFSIEKQISFMVYII